MKTHVFSRCVGHKIS